ncbi:MAG: rRNA maturation RNase YbeY [Halothiobacillus sp.]
MSISGELVWINRQKASSARCPGRARLSLWASAALVAAGANQPCALTVRFVDSEEGQALNSHYRHKNYATNVLSFPYEQPDIPEGFELPMDASQTDEKYLGDLVICMPVLRDEAKAQHKSAVAHTAHLVIHGVLHLLGYDHETPLEAEEMESLEIHALHQLGFENPYLEQSIN